MPIDMVQEFTIEVDSVKLMERYLQFALETLFWSVEKVAVRAVDYDRDLQKYVHNNTVVLKLDNCPGFQDPQKRFPIIFLEGGYEKSLLDLSACSGVVTFITPGKTVEQAVSQVKNLVAAHGSAWAGLFRRRFRPDDFDGSSGIGFRMHGSSLSGVLVIELVYIEYHK